MYGIALSDGRRGHYNATPHLKALAYVLSPTGVGLVVGTLLGVAGSLMPLTLRTPAIMIASVAGTVLGASGLVGHPVPLVQIDRETPASWVDRGPYFWAVTMAGLLGWGASTRLGFWLWYVIPPASILCGSWTAGALIYGTYGLARGGWVLIYLARSTGAKGSVDAISTLARYGVARNIAYWTLTLFSVLTFVAVGV